MFRTMIHWVGSAAVAIGTGAFGAPQAEAVDLQRARQVIVTLHSGGEQAVVQPFTPGEAAAILRDFGIPNRTPGGGLGPQPQPWRSDSTLATGFRVDDGELIVSLLPPSLRQSAALRALSSSGEPQPMTVVAWDPANHLAVLCPDHSDVSANQPASVSEPVAAAAALALSPQGAIWGSPIQVLAAWQPDSPAVATGIVATETRFDAAVGGQVFHVDALLPPEAVGGPVVDASDQVIGVIARVAAGYGAGPGTAIAIEPVERLVAFVRDGGSGPMPKPRLGVALGSSPEGVVVGTAFPGSPAQQAGLEAGDRIVSIEGVPVQSPEEVIAAVSAHRPGDSVEVIVIRDGQQQQLAITLGETPLQQPPPSGLGTAERDAAARPPISRFPADQPMTAEALRQWLEQQMGQPTRPLPGGGPAPALPPRVVLPDEPSELSDQMQQLSEQLRELREQLRQQRQREPAEEGDRLD